LVPLPLIVPKLVKGAKKTAVELSETRNSDPPLLVNGL
jgi:hypothetical protein